MEENIQKQDTAINKTERTKWQKLMKTALKMI